MSEKTYIDGLREAAKIAESMWGRKAKVGGKI
jgi:hypothetical protein